MSLAKDKYREETNEDCYCEQWQVEGGSYKDEYVLWLEQQLVNKLNLPVVSQQRELLLQCYKEGFQAAVDSLISANDAVKNKTL